MAEYHDYDFMPRVAEIGERGYLEVHPERGILARFIVEPVRR
jgi:hypothetical protein